MAAIAWRDRYIEQHGPDKIGYDKRAEKEFGRPRKNNNTGVDGVTFFYHKKRNAIQVSARWLDEERKQRRKVFTIGKKYTVEDAFFQAVKARYELTGRAEKFASLEIDYDAARSTFLRLAKEHGLEVENRYFTSPDFLGQRVR